MSTKNKEEYITILILLILCTLVLCFIPGLPFSIWAASFCQPIKYEQDIDVSPLLESTLPSHIERVSDIINPDIFASYETSEYGNFIIGKWGCISTTFDVFSGRWDCTATKRPEWSNITVTITHHAEIERAGDEFQILCGHSSDGSYKQGGNENNRYCISYLVDYRNPPDSFCTPTGHYGSDVIFQKDGIIIQIDEYSPRKDSVLKNAVIELLARVFSNQYIDVLPSP